MRRSSRELARAFQAFADDLRLSEDVQLSDFESMSSFCFRTYEIAFPDTLDM